MGEARRRVAVTPPRLSLCVIARNEQDNLPRLLRSVRGVVDETVVVDTGSTDRTRDVARAYGARVFEIPWRNDFSFARNAAIDRARGAWLLILDADEELSPASADPLRALVARDPSGPTLLTVTVSSVDDYGGLHQARSRRLASNVPGLRYARPVHEEWRTDLLDRPLEVGHVETIEVIHHGYTASERTRQEKWDRNLRLLHEQLRSGTERTITLFYLAQEYAAQGRNAEALAIYHAHLADFERELPADAWMYACQSCAIARMGSGEFREAADLAARVAADAGSLALHALAASAAVQDGDFARADAIAETALACADVSTPGTADIAPREGSIVRLLLLRGEIARRGGDVSRALDWFDRAAAILPSSAEVALHRAEAIARTDPAGARGILDKAIARTPENPALAIARARLDRRENRLQEAVDRLSEAVVLAPYMLPLRIELARALMAGAEPAIAAKVLEAARETPQFASAAPQLRVEYLDLLAEAYRASGDLPSAVRTLETMVAARQLAHPGSHHHARVGDRDVAHATA